MSILQNILAEKEKEVAARRLERPLGELKAAGATMPAARGFVRALRAAGSPAFIAEIKRASPSRGIIRGDLDPVETAKGFAQAGAACLSVLTDEKFFQGKLEFLAAICQAEVHIPLLRKDFILDPYQVWEARAAGADAILLIVAALADATLGSLLQEAASAGLDVLIEVHNVSELKRVAEILRVIGTTQIEVAVGINNRDLHSFVTDLSVTEAVMSSRTDLPAGTTFISESGIRTGADVRRLLVSGVNAFLVGESLVAQGQPGANLQQLIGESVGKGSRA